MRTQAPWPAPSVDGIALQGAKRSVVSPIDGQAIGRVIEGDEAIVMAAMAAAEAGFPAWAVTSVETRAAALDANDARLQRGQQRRVARQDAHHTFGARRNHHVNRLFGEDFSLGRDDPDAERHHS